MGQQQLLLLVLGIVLVGLAVVAGISAFSENKRKAALDVDTARTAQYAGLAVAWRATPQAMGGGQRAASSAALNLNSLGISDTGLIVRTSDYEAAQTSPGLAVAVWYRTSGTSAGPAVEVWDADNGIKTTQFLYGIEPRCHVYRYAFWTPRTRPSWDDFYINPGWNYVPANIPPAPAGCTW